MTHELNWINEERIAGNPNGYYAICSCGAQTSLTDTKEEAKSAHARHAYVEDLSSAVLHEFGYSPDEDDCLGWWEADATVDQAVEWMNHGGGPGDYAGCGNKEGAWDDDRV